MSNYVKLILSRLCGLLAVGSAVFLSKNEPTILVSAAILAYIAMGWRLDIIEGKIDELTECDQEEVEE